MSDNYNFGEDIPYELAPESTDRDYKRNIWDAAIGLQAVDGLKPSEYLRKLAEENINGQKTYEDVSRELNKEYGNTEFKMSMDLLLSIHDFLFDGVLDPNIVGKFRRYNIKKKEPILFGDTVHYTDHLSIKSQLQFYLEEEKEYNYSMPLSDEDIDHLSSFTRKIWQTHPFGEGNTRTTAVFIEMYLISLGSRVDNEPFKDNSQFYRNALVRSCYSSEVYAVKPTNSFLNHFYKNLLCGSEYVLDSFDLFISNKEDINYSNDDIPKDTNNDPDPFG